MRCGVRGSQTLSAIQPTSTAFEWVRVMDTCKPANGRGTVQAHAWARDRAHTDLAHPRFAEVFKLISASGYPGVRLRIISIDPGVRNVYVAYSSDGLILKMSLGEYHSLAKTEEAKRTLARILDGVQLPRLHAVHSAHLADAIDYAADVAANFDRLQAIYGDRRLRETRFTVRCIPSG